MRRYNDGRSPLFLIIILGLLVAGTMFYSLITASYMAQRYAPLADATMVIKLEAALSHLWLEELLSGDDSIDIETVWRHLDMSVLYARAMLEGGETPEGLLVPLNDLVLRNKIELVLVKLENFRNTANMRWEAGPHLSPGTDSDHRFDVLFDELLGHADEVEIALRDSMSRYLNRFRILQRSLIVFVLGVAFLIAVIFHRFSKQRAVATATLRESEQRFRGLVESTSDWIWETDSEGVYTYSSPQVEAILGYRPQEIIGKTPFSLMPPVEAERVEPLFRDSIQAGEAVVAVENMNFHKDGRTVILETSTTPIIDAFGKVVGCRGVDRDITERKRAEQELLASAQKLSLLVERTPMAVIVWNLDFEVIEWNPSAEGIFGFTQDEAFGRHAAFIVPESARKHVDTVWEGLLKQSGGTRSENVNITKAGSSIVCEWYNTTLVDVEDQVIGVASLVMDITERTQAEKERVKLEDQLRQAQKMEAVGQLAGGVAHDFNNILQAILSNGEIIQEHISDDSPIYDEIDQVMNAGLRAKKLVHQLLAFSRQQMLQLEDLNLNDLIVDLMKMISRILGEHINLEIMSGHNLGTVRADHGQIGQILTNLCINARDSMPAGGTITIETENVRIDKEFCQSHAWAKPGRFALLSVTDTGCGMDAETCGQIFEPFFTTKEIGRGTGLGLATVYGLVKQHEGMIEVYSEPDQGTTFKIYLPVVERIAKTVGNKFLGPVIGGTETILLAEDDEMVRKVCRKILEVAGYTILTAVDGEDALAVIDKQGGRIDLALLDVVMPKIGGRAVSERIRKKYPETRILFASGYSTNAVHTNFVLDKDLELISKPYQRVDLLRKVRETLDRV